MNPTNEAALLKQIAVLNATMQTIAAQLQQIAFHLSQKK